jgi:hypothetical protein
MGNYAECWSDTFYIGSTKDDIDPSLIELFRSPDKHIISGTKKDFPARLRNWADYVQWADDIEDDEIVDVVFYSASAIVVRDRLNFIGYTLDTSKSAFTRWLNLEIENYEKLSQKHYGAVFEDLKLISLPYK